MPNEYLFCRSTRVCFTHIDYINALYTFYRYQGVYLNLMQYLFVICICIITFSIDASAVTSSRDDTTSLIILEVNDSSMNHSMYSQDDSIRTDRYFISSPEDKSYLAPCVEILGINGIMASHNRFVSKYNYAYIDLETVKHNFKTGFVWDDNRFVINQIGHPYQGSLYYSAAKYYGHDYRVGFFYTLFGSFQWELFMENELPAYNDIVTTSTGGPMLGEILYRLSEKVLDDNSHGVERVVRETAATLINPVLGLNRLINGEAFRISQSRRRTDVSAPLNLQINTGAQIKLKSDDSESDEPNIHAASTTFRLAYGDLYLRKKIKNPFDVFLLDVDLNYVEKISSVNILGVIWNKKLPLLNNRLMLNAYHNYDYLNSSIYEIGTTSFGIGLSAILPINDNGWSFYYLAQINAIMMGGASTEYYMEVNRDYNLGPGAGTKLIAAIVKRDFFRARLKLDRYWIHTISGAAGDEMIGLGTIELSKDIWKNLGVTFAFNFFDRFGFYHNKNTALDDINEHSTGYYGYVTYTIW